MLHSRLDWRLALDLADLASGQPLSLRRWSAGADARLAAFCDGFGFRREVVGGLHAAQHPASKRVALFGHPLWRHDEAFWVEEQAEAAEEARSRLGASEVAARDLMELIRWPGAAATWLYAA
jgi:DEAD/DEAH box helicase domain-containing protein